MKDEYRDRLLARLKSFANDPVALDFLRDESVIMRFIVSLLIDLSAALISGDDGQENRYVYRDAERRYENDAAYHAVVYTLMAAIEELHLTPGELRDAAMLAAIIWERRTASLGIEGLRSERRTPGSSDQGSREAPPREADSR